MEPVELPADVDVETATFLAYSDGRPPVLIMAGTRDEHVQHYQLSPQADRLLVSLMNLLVTEGMLTPIEAPDAG